jgi:iron complex transport system ATP-binding protein
VIACERVSVAYDGRYVVRGLDLPVTGGAWLGLIGPNGAGKTTLLRAIGGHVGFEGGISVLGERVTSGARLARLVAYVPQRPAIPEGMAVVDYVLLGRTPYIPYLGNEGRGDLAVVADVLERLDLTSFAQRSLGSLSGGELQRAVLGRALAQQAPVLLLDEPTSALDIGHQQQVLELIDRLRTEDGLTVVAAMHDLTLAGQFADELALISGGRLAATGRPEEVLTEGVIRAHYDADVRVLHDGDGIVVVPARQYIGSARPWV